MSCHTNISCLISIKNSILNYAKAKELHFNKVERNQIGFDSYIARIDGN